MRTRNRVLLFALLLVFLTPFPAWSQNISSNPSPASADLAKRSAAFLLVGVAALTVSIALTIRAEKKTRDIPASFKEAHAKGFEEGSAVANQIIANALRKTAARLDEFPVLKPPPELTQGFVETAQATAGNQPKTVKAEIHDGNLLHRGCPGNCGKACECAGTANRD